MGGADGKVFCTESERQKMENHADAMKFAGSRDRDAAKATISATTYRKSLFSAALSDGTYCVFLSQRYGYRGFPA